MKRLISTGIALVVFAGCAGFNHTVPLTDVSAVPRFSSRLDRSSPSAHSRIQHVVIIFQENRTPDNLFQGLPGADIASSGRNAQGQIVKLHAVPLGTPYDLSHEHEGFSVEYAGGQMNGWSLEPSSHACPRQDKSICAFGYVRRSDVVPYFEMARRYVFADRMFQTNQGPSYPAHQFIVSADADAMPKSTLEIGANPLSPSHFRGSGGGCDAPRNQRVALIDARGFFKNFVYPCFDRPALSDLVDAKGLTWRYYQEGYGDGLWRAFDSISHVRYGADYANVISPPETILSDVVHGNLANVVWVTPAGRDSDHSGSGYSGGPAWVAAIVNAIGKSPYWKSTTILVTWDDWGGWFDHVAPPMRNSLKLGFRVPLIVISPYSKRGYVSHVRYEFGSLIRYAENTFQLGSLGKTDAVSDGLRDCFDFGAPPRGFRRIPAPPYHPSKGSGQPPPDDEF
jgi:phospholipase C